MITDKQIILAVVALGALVGGTLLGQFILYLQDKRAAAAILDKVRQDTLQSHLFNK